ncbi:related to cytochrome P450 monooxygenase [Ramularia collo-cygni]|uniref:Related to cytochrome P450 monooxygenase n=1 Tax=Ramularia collo-cygni TaxID=112498 RepID=A0A2D3VBJ6_9PEZI|nr:related to cytochrome P450 monooxygenase [Ramularia collo-cygni]CZT24350.1 related to cytochrome P450 monooxygenase [Ramularia collo-cygni]
MTLPMILLAAAIVALTILIYKFLIYPTWISPLSRCPNAHWSSAISPLWILYHRQQQKDTPTVHAAHTRLGPVIRLAPNELSVNLVDGGIRTIYSGGFEKGEWYSNVFGNYGVEPMFAMECRTEHSQRKRMVSNVYAKSTLQSSPALTKQTEIILRDRLYPRMRGAAQRGDVIELYDVFSAVTMDFVAAYVFGMKHSCDFITDVPAGVKFFEDFKSRQRYTFWPQELPNFTRWMEHLGLKWLLVPNWVASSNFSIEDWVMAMCNKAEASLKRGDHLEPQDTPTVYAQLRSTFIKSAQQSSGKEESTDDILDEVKLHIASELVDHTLAGYDTSSITLTWMAWQLSRPQNLHWQQRLQQEISTLQGSLDAKSIESLPVLHAVMMETLRLHAAIPGNQPRVTPALPAVTSLGDPEAGIVYKGLPPGTRVQAQAWSLHRNPEVFPEPDEWNPARWLDAGEEQQREMGRWFWAFGSGGRMCVGSNLAMLDMKATMVGLWGCFSTEIVDDKGMVPNGGYMAEPLGVGPHGVMGVEFGRSFLRCRLREVKKM